jgi:hypothetical protein
MNAIPAGVSGAEVSSTDTPAFVVRGRQPARGRRKLSQPGGLRTGSPPSPPPRLIRPTVRRLPRSPRFSGPGPRDCHSAAAFAVLMLSISAIIWNSVRYSCRLCASQRTTRALASSLATYPFATVRCRLSTP